MPIWNGTLQKFSASRSLFVCRSLFVWIGTPHVRIVHFSQIDVFVINVTVDHKNLYLYKMKSAGIRGRWSGPHRLLTCEPSDPAETRYGPLDQARHGSPTH
jgi:hypothetical protein